MFRYKGSTIGPCWYFLVFYLSYFLSLEILSTWYLAPGYSILCGATYCNIQNFILHGSNVNLTPFPGDRHSYRDCRTCIVNAISARMSPILIDTVLKIVLWPIMTILWRRLASIFLNYSTCQYIKVRPASQALQVKNKKTELLSLWGFNSVKIISTLTSSKGS